MLVSSGTFHFNFDFDCCSCLDAVLIAVGITAAVTLALTVFALQTKIDFTVCGGDQLVD